MNLAKKLNENINILERWHQSISKYPILDIMDVRSLIKEYINETDETKKINIRNKIVLGTQEYVYRFLKESIFIPIICNWFNMEDVISASIESWIRNLEYYNKKVIIKLCENKYQNSIYERAFIKNILCYLGNNNMASFASSFKFNGRMANFSDWYYLYLKEKENNPNYSFEDFKLTIKEVANENDEFLRKIYDIFRYLSKVIVIDSKYLTMDFIEKVKYLLASYTNMIIVDDKNISLEEDWVDNIINKDMTQEIFDNPAIIERRKNMLYKIYYLGQTHEDIAKDEDISHQCIDWYIQRTFKKIREKHPELVRDKKY